MICRTVPVETSPPSIQPDRASSSVASWSLGSGDVVLSCGCVIGSESYASSLCAAGAGLYDLKHSGFRFLSPLLRGASHDQVFWLDRPVARRDRRVELLLRGTREHAQRQRRGG